MSNAERKKSVRKPKQRRVTRKRGGATSVSKLRQQLAALGSNVAQAVARATITMPKINGPTMEEIEAKYGRL